MLYVTNNNKYLDLNESDFERKPHCECYGEYGMVLGCTDAACYSLDNGSFAKIVAKDILEEMGIVDDLEEFDVDEFIAKYGDVEGFAEARDEVEEHYEVTVYETFENGNWKSYVKSADDGVFIDLYEVDADWKTLVAEKVDEIISFKIFDNEEDFFEFTSKHEILTSQDDEQDYGVLNMFEDNLIAIKFKETFYICKK